MQDLNEKLEGLQDGMGFLIPELILSGALLIIIIAGLINKRRNLLFASIAVLAAVTSMGWNLAIGFDVDSSLFDGLMRKDGFGSFLTLLVDTSVILTCLLSRFSADKSHRPEYYALVVCIGLGAHTLLMSTHLVMVLLSLEIISISSYVLAGFSFDRRGSEGSLKYFLYGAIASATMLYGFSILYGLTGTLEFSSRAFAERLMNESSPLLMIAGMMGLSGFLFKIAAVPMHTWAPDVYEAAPMPVVAFFSVAPKLAGIGILTRFVLSLHSFGQGAFDWQVVIGAIALVTILFGNLTALWQKNPKRMMAYSSIAHSGFLLVGIAAFLPQGIQFMLFYASIYLIMNFAVFAFLMAFEERGLETMPSYRGIGRHFPWAASGLTIGLVALSGLPPTAGFTAKLFIFSGLWEAYLGTHKTLLIWLLFIGLLNTVISLFYYLRIPFYAFIQSGETVVRPKKGYPENLLGFILVVVVVALFFVPGLLMGLINRINFAL